jgi:hypothetical protein
MPIDTHPARARGRTPEEINAQQKEQAAKDKAARKATPLSAKPAGAVAAVTPEVLAETGKLPTLAAGTAVAMPAPDNRTNVQRYVDEIAPANIVGRLIKFGKEGAFVTADDGEPVSESADFLALCDETLIGWIKFSKSSGDDATPPERVQGLLYDGFVMPPRNTLGDNDQTQWEAGLSGQLEDPWKHQVCLVLQNTETKEFYTFATTSLTGRRSVGNLLRHFDRMQRTNVGEVPIVRLKAGGFNHRDDRIGWVSTPVFAVVGRAPRDSAAKPDTAAADMNDRIPF